MTPTPTTSEDVIDSINEALKDDNLNTRQGLRFMATVLKGAMKVISEITENRASMGNRITNMEDALHNYLTKQEAKDKKADEERAKWRWALIAPTAAFAVIELIKWIFR